MPCFVATRAHLRNTRHYQSTSSRNYLKMAPETPKGASSRLLSMKFMQRAAASAGSTPDSDAPSSKKRRLDRGDNDYDLNITSESIQAAIDERDAKRQAAIQQHASNDTHWVLNTNVGNMAGKSEKKPMRVQYVGYDDFESDEDVDKTQLGRTSTKKNKVSKLSTIGLGKVSLLRLDRNWRKSSHKTQIVRSPRKMVRAKVRMKTMIPAEENGNAIRMHLVREVGRCQDPIRNKAPKPRRRSISATNARRRTSTLTSQSHQYRTQVPARPATASR